MGKSNAPTSTCLHYLTWSLAAALVCGNRVRSNLGEFDQAALTSPLELLMRVMQPGQSVSFPIVTEICDGLERDSSSLGDVMEILEHALSDGVIYRTGFENQQDPERARKVADVFEPEIARKGYKALTILLEMKYNLSLLNDFCLRKRNRVVLLDAKHAGLVPPGVAARDPQLADIQVNAKIFASEVGKACNEVLARKVETETSGRRMQHIFSRSRYHW
eukprot:TRINITY_DN22182_c0_g1_i1.p1 TRINITY_DN22182_c0_g1~~TRINITY_DN22182_c0_g1_i1.p1  ORF type:complete len:219 (+),score=38.63 TRINITY_DN22182_c0_g1_i1:81-737(+)